MRKLPLHRRSPLELSVNDDFNYLYFNMLLLQSFSMDSENLEDSAVWLFLEIDCCIWWKLL